MKKSALQAYAKAHSIEASELLDYAKECEERIAYLELKIADLRGLARQARQEYAMLVDPASKVDAESFFCFSCKRDKPYTQAIGRDANGWLTCCACSRG